MEKKINLKVLVTYLVFAKQSSKAVIHNFKINCKLMQ